MKKLLSLLLAFAMVTVLTACGSGGKAGAATIPVTVKTTTPDTTAATESATQQQTDVPTEAATEEATTEVTEEATVQTQDGEMTLEEFPSFIGAYVDLAHYGEMEAYGDYCTYYMESSYRPQEDAQPPMDGYITVDGSVKIVLGETKVSELLDLGWQFVGGEKTAEEMLEGNHWFTSFASNLKKGDKELNISLANLTDKDIPYSDACIHSVMVRCWDSRADYQAMAVSAVDFDMDGKVNQDSDLADIIAAFGEPVSITYTKVGSGTIKVSWDLVRITLSSDGTKIEELSFQ